jgi:hypothetical protein
VLSYITPMTSQMFQVLTSLFLNCTTSMTTYNCFTETAHQDRQLGFFYSKHIYIKITRQFTDRSSQEDRITQRSWIQSRARQRHQWQQRRRSHRRRVARASRTRTLGWRPRSASVERGSGKPMLEEHSDAQ